MVGRRILDIFVEVLTVLKLAIMIKLQDVVSVLIVEVLGLGSTPGFIGPAEAGTGGFERPKHSSKEDVQ